jgi:hypothetical protein
MFRTFHLSLVLYFLLMYLYISYCRLANDRQKVEAMLIEPSNVMKIAGKAVRTRVCTCVISFIMCVYEKIRNIYY